tara:strand:+ start:3171 stop:4295 length:1125 start_codon:yes stop_codon:yes gene_type:complete
MRTVRLANTRNSKSSSDEVAFVLFFVLVLVSFGIVMVFSSTIASETDYLTRHLIFVAAGLSLLGLMSITPLRLLRDNFRWALVLAFFLAIITFFYGVEINGAKRWVRVGGATFQISEWAKVLLLIYLCGYLSRYYQNLLAHQSRFLIPVFFIVLFCCLLVVQPDLGTAVLITLTCFSLLFLIGVRLRYFFVLFLVFSLALFFLIISEPERVERVTAFSNPWMDQWGSGWQLSQALIAFGRGEWLGVGLGGSIQKLFYLPEAHNDFILAVVAEETGILGCSLLLLVFTLLISKIFSIGKRCLQDRHNFSGLACYFVGILFSLQILINVGVSTGALPTKGLTLPLISYGGNSMVVSLFMLGIVLRSSKEMETHDSH